MADRRRAELADALLATAGGDRLALRLVYERTSAKLFGICLRICNERSAAEDVLQTVYLKVWQRAGSFDPDKASPVTWLATIARNAALDWRRSQRESDPLPADLDQILVDEGADALELAEAKEERARIFHCLGKLDEQRKGAIHAAFYRGLSYPEIAQASGTPLGTVKSWVRRGLMQLKECLQGE